MLVKNLVVNFAGKNRLLNSKKRSTIKKVVAHFSLLRSEFSLLKRISTSDFFSVSFMGTSLPIQAV